MAKNWILIQKKYGVSFLFKANFSFISVFKVYSNFGEVLLLLKLFVGVKKIGKFFFNIKVDI